MIVILTGGTSEWNAAPEQLDAQKARLQEARRPAIHHKSDEAVTKAIRAEAAGIYGEGPTADQAAHDMEHFAHERGLLQRRPPIAFV